MSKAMFTSIMTKNYSAPDDSIYLLKITLVFGWQNLDQSPEGTKRMLDKTVCRTFDLSSVQEIKKPSSR